MNTNGYPQGDSFPGSDPNGGPQDEQQNSIAMDPTEPIAQTVYQQHSNTPPPPPPSTPSSWGLPPDAPLPPQPGTYGQYYNQATQTQPSFQRSAPAPRQPGKLARPVPLWAFVGSIVLVVVLLAVLHLTGSDWAAGAANASFAALIIAILLLIVFIVRRSNGMGSTLNPIRRRQQWLSITGIILLFVYFVTCQALQAPLHLAQARALEGQQQWQAAIDEYKLGGVQAPDGEDPARVYVSWGQQLSHAGRYNEALNKFDTVLKQFNSSAVSNQVKQAQAGDIDARIAIGNEILQAKNYDNATSYFDSILALPYCDTTCHTRTSKLDATAYFDLGETHFKAKEYQAATTAFDKILNSFADAPEAKQARALDATSFYNMAEKNLSAQEYASAVSTFDTVLSRFADTPEANKLHPDMAKALLGQGKQTRSSDCSTAITIYQRLAKEYRDTPEGKTAQNDLNAPQDVKGHFRNTEPQYHFSQIALVKGLFGNMGTDQLFYMWDNAPYKTTIQDNGDFTFTGVDQGDYDLMWYTSDGVTEHVEYIYDPTYLTPTYTAKVGQLCTTTVDDVTNATS